MQARFFKILFSFLLSLTPISARAMAIPNLEWLLASDENSELSQVPTQVIYDFGKHLSKRDQLNEKQIRTLVSLYRNFRSDKSSA